MRLVFSALVMSGLFAVPAFSFDFSLHSSTNAAVSFCDGALSEFIQPAASGKLESGLYGMTRNNGTRFHEGIDIKSFIRDEKGRAADEVFSVADGNVVHVCRENNGSYGKYVVVEHASGGITFYTLYAHLSEVDSGIAEKSKLRGGQRLGIIGETSTVYKFPAGTEHLHFEVGLRLGEDSFSAWYKSTFPSDDKNLHSFWNGLNLAGLDPVLFFRESGKYRTFNDWLKSQPTAFSVKIKTNVVPEILKFSPGLLRKPLRERAVCAWMINFSWSGVPLGFYPIFDEEKSEPLVKIENVYKKYIQDSIKRGLLSKNKSGVVPGKNLKNTLRIILGSDIRM